MTAPDHPVHQRARDAAAEILALTGHRPRVGMLLGTGHSSIANQLKDKKSIRHDDLPDGLKFAQESPLHVGLLEDVPVVVADAPLAPYEGHSVADTTYPVRVLRAMGAEVLVLTAAATSLSAQLEPGTVAVIEDHLNLSGVHPLEMPYEEQLGPRFPDMSAPYNAGLREVARSMATEVGVPCLPAVFAAIPGPSLPTRAEYRAYRRLGADLVGMSLAPEVTAAVHSGLRVLALVSVTQAINPDDPQSTSIESMLDAADLAAPRVAAMLAGIVRMLPP